MKYEMEALTQVCLCALKVFLFCFLGSSWSNKSSSLSLQILPLFISLRWGHLNYRNRADNRGANQEIGSFFILPFLLPVETGKTALSALL